jgi:hypothetical protein
MGDYSIVYVDKFTCDRCGREIIVNLFAKPEHRVDDDLKLETLNNSKTVHLDGCVGGSAPPEPYRRIRV